MHRKGENMRILILSCNTGGGHNAAGRAVKEIFEKNGDEAVLLDYLCLAGNKVSKTVGNVYTPLEVRSRFLLRPRTVM